ncbi:WD40-repeat-containing domain protein [Panaeolus papilionaceus]|nr:WD40-repeat-containing domain protein [Panaeolus papilionaceus]
MPGSEQFIDSEDETLGELYDGEDDEEDQGDVLMNAADDVTEGEDDSQTDESDEEEDEDEEEEEEEEEEELVLDLETIDDVPQPSEHEPSSPLRSAPSRPPSAPPQQGPLPPERKRSLSPSHLRRQALIFDLRSPPRGFTVEAICALPHPTPTHALAASSCMTHLLTGSDDGYIRDYDIFAAVNGKSFLTAPQRHHAGVVEGLMKSGQLRFWWENPVATNVKQSSDDDSTQAPVFSLAAQSDALWALAGTDAGYINLFTVRHDPGRLCHVMHGHKGHVSALALDYDEKSLFSAGWDGMAIQWDLNTGQNVRNFGAHGAQLASLAIRPQSSYYVQTIPDEKWQNQASDTNQIAEHNMDVDSTQAQQEQPPKEDGDSDAKSDTSFDPLFDDEPEDDTSTNLNNLLAMPGSNHSQQPHVPKPAPSSVAPPKGAPPTLTPSTYHAFSPEILMTTFIDGQIILWDRRVQSPGRGVGRLEMTDKTPPWCLSACWSADGAQIYAGRRNGTVDVWDVRLLGHAGPSITPRILRTLRNPTSSGVVSCVAAFPDARHIACASIDNIRLWNVAENVEDTSMRSRSGVQFKIIPGHHGGYISQMLVDPGARFLISASSNRGWHGDSTRTVFVHDIKHVF